MTSSKQAQRTPGPWQYAANVGPTKALIVERDGSTIAEIHGNGSAFATNVRFIVTACNAHDALVARVAELEAAAKRLTDEIFRADGFRTREMSIAARALRAALKGQA